MSVAHCPLVLSCCPQVPDLTVWYGPDTYMGLNLAELFNQLAHLPDEEIQELHPAHTAASIRALLPRLHHYTDGTCIVHHIFGGETCEVVQQVRRQQHTSIMDISSHPLDSCLSCLSNNGVVACCSQTPYHEVWYRPALLHI